MEGRRARFPLVSIGLPAFNCEKTLSVAIRSILNQTYDNWELLLVEDGSSDRTLEVARSFPDPRILVFTNHVNKGLISCLNRAVSLSRGKYFARMDADDVAYPERLRRQVEHLEQHPEIDLLGCGMLVFKGQGIALGTRPNAETHREICRRPNDGFYIGHPTWMGRTTWFWAHPYDPKAVRAEDQVLLLKNYQASCFANLPEILCGYRENGLDLGKVLRGRYTFTKAVIRNCVKRQEYYVAIGAVLRQFGKTFLDCLAAITDLEHLILPHRARSLDSANLDRWTEIWTRLPNLPTYGSDRKCIGQDLTSNVE